MKVLDKPSWQSTAVVSYTRSDDSDLHLQRRVGKGSPLVSATV